MLEYVVIEMYNKASTSSTYITESIDLWHARLGHVNAKSMDWLHKIDMILNLDKSDITNMKYALTLNPLENRLKQNSKRK